MKVTLRQQRYPDRSIKHLMKCGHSAEGYTEDGKPICVICWPTPECMEVVDELPDITGRKARCCYFGKKIGRPGKCECDDCMELEVCGCERDSSIYLAFFEYKPDKENDVFYCGCHSWD